MKRCAAGIAIGWAALLGGCNYNCYVVEITPQGQALERRLTCWHEEEAGGAGRKTSAMPDEELQRIGKLYLHHEAPDAAGKAVFSGRFTDIPGDVGGAGSYTHLGSPLGTASVYVERFRGNDDLEGELARRRAAADQLADLALGWFETEMGGQPAFARLRKFLDEDFRQDLKNLGLYGWTGDALAGPERRTSLEPAIRAAQYLVERDYLRPADMPGLVRAATTGDADGLTAYVQKLVVRKLGLSADDPPPNYLAFLASDRRAHASLARYVQGTERFKDRQARWIEERHHNPKAKPPTADDLLGELLCEAFLPLDMLAPADLLKLRLACPQQPFETNGTWDAKAARVTWSAALGKHPALPVLCYALWSAADEPFQTAHFGRVILRGADLGQYVQWYRALSAAEAREWDEGLLAQCHPGAELIARIKSFQFRRDAQPGPDAAVRQPTSLADAPRQLLLKALQTSTSAPKDSQSPLK